MKRIIIVLLVGLFFSCASRKVNKHNEKTEISKSEQLESVDIIKKDIVTDITANIDIFILNSEFIIKPVNNSKPMTVGGKIFTNAAISAKKSQSKAIGIVNKKETDNSEITSQINQKSATKTSHTTKSKETKRGSNYWYWLILILIIVLGYRVYKKYQR